MYKCYRFGMWVYLLCLTKDHINMYRNQAGHYRSLFESVVWSTYYCNVHLTPSIFFFFELANVTIKKAISLSYSQISITDMEENKPEAR